MSKREMHGLHGIPEYEVWKTMKGRCYNSKAVAFKNYGARGITVCERWRNSFIAFISDMGRCPPGLSIERKDNDGNYEPGNCCWATRKEQALNRRIRSVCKNGHKFTPENIAVGTKDKGTRTFRICLECKKEEQKIRDAKVTLPGASARLINLIGKRFSRLLVVSRADNTSLGQARWSCQCDCGNLRIANGDSLRSGHTKSCGCLQADVIGALNRKDQSQTRISAGIYWNEKEQKFSVRIGSVYVGRYDLLEDAKAARKEAEQIWIEIHKSDLI